MSKIVLLCLVTLAFVAAASAQEGAVPNGVPKLDHVFIIMMENHGFSQLVGNPDTPFANELARSENGHQLFRHRTSELDQLPRSGWRLQLRRALR